MPSILIDGGISVPWLKTLVFLRLMVRPKSEHADENKAKIEGQNKVSKNRLTTTELYKWARVFSSLIIC